MSTTPARFSRVVTLLLVLARPAWATPDRPTIERDIAVMTGGHFSPHHIGLDEHLAILARFEQDRPAYVDAFEDLYLRRPLELGSVPVMLTYFVHLVGQHDRPTAARLARGLRDQLTRLAQVVHRFMAEQPVEAYDPRELAWIERHRAEAAAFATRLVAPDEATVIDDLRRRGIGVHGADDIAIDVELIDLGFHAEALARLEARIAARPDHALVDYDHAWAALCLARLDRPREALGHYRVVRTRFPGLVTRTSSPARDWDARLAEVRAIVARSAHPERDAALAGMDAIDAQHRASTLDRVRELVRRVAAGDAPRESLHDAEAVEALGTLIERGVLRLRE